MKKKLAPLIVIDPGHGTIPTEAFKRSDPGVVAPNGTKESVANLASAVTLAFLLKQEGYRVQLTRTDEQNPGYPARVKDIGQSLLISVHYDTHILSAPTSGCYYRGLHGRPKLGESQKLAKLLGKALRPNAWVRPSTSSNHKRLYIDDCGAFPAVMLEIDRISDYQDTKEYRLERLTPVVTAIKSFLPLE